MSDRVQRLTQGGRWLESGAAGHIARAAEASHLDLDLVLNAEVRFDDGVCREIDVLAVGDDAVVALEVKSGDGFAGEGGRFAEIVERLGLAAPQAILLAPSMDQQTMRDLGTSHPITVSDGSDVAVVSTTALDVPRRRGHEAVPADIEDATAERVPTPPVDPTEAAEGKPPTPAEIEAAAVQILSSTREPVTLSDLIRLVRDELATSRRWIQPTILELGRAGRLTGTDGAPVAHYQDVVVRLVGDAARATARDETPAPVDRPGVDDTWGRRARRAERLLAGADTAMPLTASPISMSRTRTAS